MRRVTLTGAVDRAVSEEVLQVFGGRRQGRAEPENNHQHFGPDNTVSRIALAPIAMDAKSASVYSSRMALEFEWDSGKADRNLREHGVSFDDATSVFRDRLSITITDPDHSASEHRFIDIGMSHRGELLVVSYTERSDRIRIISARRATRAERRNYEEAT